jgi:hypothetical protein
LLPNCNSFCFFSGPEFLSDTSTIVFAICCGISLSLVVNWNGQTKVAVNCGDCDTVEKESYEQSKSSCMSVIWSNRSRFYTNEAIFEKKRIVFVTTTKQSLTQVATLIKIGQALFPVRDKVVWVVVSLTTNENVVYKGAKCEFLYNLMDTANLY